MCYSTRYHGGARTKPMVLVGEYGGYGDAQNEGSRRFFVPAGARCNGQRVGFRDATQIQVTGPLATVPFQVSVYS